MSRGAPAKKRSKESLQSRVRGKARLEAFFRHLGNLSIDLDEEEIEVQSTFPDDAEGFASGNLEMTRTLDLEEHPELRAAVKQLVALCQEAVLRKDPQYDPNRCDRCVKSDCCWIDRIHLTDEERVAILDHLGLDDTRANTACYFTEDDDLAGFYRHMMRHEDGHCVFLKKVGGVMRCSVYEVRPKVCRDYDAGYCTDYTKLLPRRPELSV